MKKGKVIIEDLKYETVVTPNRIKFTSSIEEDKRNLTISGSYTSEIECLNLFISRKYGQECLSLSKEEMLFVIEHLIKIKSRLGLGLEENN